MRERQKYRPTRIEPPERFRRRQRRLVCVIVGDGTVKCGGCGVAGPLSDAADFLVKHRLCQQLPGGDQRSG